MLGLTVHIIYTKETIQFKRLLNKADFEHFRFCVRDTET